MKRREFITFLGAAAAAWPLAARAQQPKMPVIGFMNFGTPEGNHYLRVAFLQGLSETGYVEGRNVAIEYRWAEVHIDRLPALAADLVSRQVAVIVATGGNASALAAKGSTSTIPIVFSSADDPVATGLVSSLNRPGGNVTGVSWLGAALGSKVLDLLRGLTPDAAIAMLVNSNNSVTESERVDVEAAARVIGQKIQILNANTEGDFDAAFAKLVQQRPAALLVATDTYFLSKRDKLIALAAKHGIPAIFPLREFVADGGLMSYGPSLTDVYRRVGTYTGRILKGEARRLAGSTAN